MKKLFIIFVALFTSALKVFSDNIVVSNVTITNDEYSVVNVEFNNSTSDIVALQFNITLPNEVIPEEENGSITIIPTDRIIGNYIIKAKQVANGSYLFMYMSSERKPIQGTDGELFSFRIKNRSLNKGSYKADVSDVIETKINGIDKELSPTSFNINLQQIYTVSYKLDGTVYKDAQYNYGEAIPQEASPAKEGYTFSGWSEIPATMPAHDLEVTGSFTVNQYKVAFVSEGKSIKEETLDFGTAIVAPQNPTKIGHTFKGWSPCVSAIVPAHDVTYTAQFMANQYTITFDTDGGSILPPITQDYNSAITAPSTPTKVGYTFAGWDKNMPSAMPAGNMTIKALWTVNKYKLTYIVDGSVYKEADIDYNAAVTAETAPTKEGHSFSGWSTIPSTMPAKDVEIIGSFTVNQYKLSFVVDGDTLSSTKVDYGTELKTIDAPVREGETFSGWSTLPKTMPARDVVITGTFSANSYKLTYKVDGEIYEEATVVYGTSITAIDGPTKEGYTFGGWSELPATMPSKDVEIVGSFTVNQYRLSFVVDGDTLSSTKVDYGTELKTIDAPVREGETFSGWSTLPKTMPARDVVITGTFSANSYKLTYKVDGEIYEEATVVYGTSITAIDGPTKEGYTFGGWSELPATMPSKDVEITGSFTVNQYRLSFVVDGDTLSSTKVDYGAELKAIDSPVREGETFSGWSTLPKTMPAKDVVITGTFSANSYKLTYKVNGEIYEGTTVVYGTSITAIDEPTKEGYTFSGWSELPETMPSKDVEIVGSFAVNQYRLSFVVDGDTLSNAMVDYGTELKAIDAPVREGETFSGWSTLPKTMPARDVVITGTFSANSYKLTYKVDGEIYEEATVVYGTSITAIDGPTKEGYTFGGWSELPATMPSKDVEIVGSFTVNQYRLSFVVDGDTLSSTKVDYGAELKAIDSPVREGETFSGWSTIPKTMPAKDVVITGTFSANSYKLTYKVDGEIYEETTVVYGTSITAIDEPTKEGYTFSGWSELPETMPAKDVEITGSFTVNQYRLSFVVDGDTLSSTKVDYGAELKAIDSPVREGETFSGWSTLPKTMPAKDVVITGTFSANSYKLTYKVNGEIYEETTVVYGTSITAIDEPTKEGYTFSGWSELPETMPAKDVEITGSFTVNQYRLSFVVDGDTLSSTKVDYGTELKAIDAPVREGETFSGWSTLPKTMPARDVVITGTFSANSYKLTYKVDGEIYEEATVVYGTSITAIDGPTKEGYTFSGWSELPETMPAKDVEITGSFTVNQYRLSYVVDGDTLSSTKVAYGTELKTIDAPVREGKTFSGWSTIPKTMPARDLVVTGTFATNIYCLKYILDGELYNESKVAYGSAITPLDTLTKEGYTFYGWSEIPSTMPANDVVVTGYFALNQYKLAYVVDGDTVSTVLVDYGMEIIAIDDQVKDGYTFSGWIDLPKTMPAKDVIVSGMFSANSYKLTYKVDGEIYEESHVVYGSTLTTIDEPTKEGYTFSGWSEIPTTMPANDVTVTGSFTINHYKLAFVVDEDTVSTEMVDYGKEITAIDEPEKEGYVFSGWSEIPETMPANDVTVTGSFAINNYLLTYMVDSVEVYSDSITYGDSIAVLEIPTKEGYTFSGWSEIPETMPANDVVVTGSFTINHYKLAFVVDEDTVSTEMVDYGKEITAIDEPEKEGYVFSGWSEIPETMPANDVTVIGSFTVNSYVVIYLVEDVEVRRDTVLYGAEIPDFIYESENELIVFNGWTGEKYDNMPAHDVTYEADISYLPVTINSLLSRDNNITIYTIYGTKVQIDDIRTLPSGVYIINSKKYFVK